jgi:hypothetical protein
MRNMPLPLREPFFLRGRTSVLQRAVIMSLVLVGLAAAGGWVVAAAVLWSQTSHSSLLFPLLAWGFAATTCIDAPLNYWNRRSWLWTLSTLPTATVLFFAWSCWIGFARSTLDLCEQLAAPWGFLGVQLLHGLLQLRQNGVYWLAYLLSLSGVILPSLIINRIYSLAHANVAGLSYEELRPIIFAAVYVSWFAALAIPWGIPFWWPPQPESPPEPTL